ncbi:hypothetical protein RhiirA4_474807 [Rhizophagus irregularis]|uniref:Uncharacterized protein n=1 Tax=Rhizophagus irregularis TaxID=588596 RepID=A0A2I1H947_9GLOM|nr:hypothetical protein RhiirA4_474807 [Rhizophagus irregularis]
MNNSRGRPLTIITPQVIRLDIMIILHPPAPKILQIIIILPSILYLMSAKAKIALSSSSTHITTTTPPNPTGSKFSKQEILTLFKGLQENMTSIYARVHALELADQRMSRLESCVLDYKQDDVIAPDPNEFSHMLIDEHQ